MRFLQTSGASAVAARLLGATESFETAPVLEQPQGTSKPNILFMLVDNLGYGELGASMAEASRAINIIDMTSFSKVALLASPSGLRFEDDPKARAGRLSEALQRIG